MNKARPLARVPIHTIRESPTLHSTRRPTCPVANLDSNPPNSTTGVYHQAGQDYTISMQPLQHGFDTNDLPMHIPAPKLAFNSFATPPYVNYLQGP